MVEEKSKPAPLQKQQGCGCFLLCEVSPKGITCPHEPRGVVFRLNTMRRIAREAVIFALIGSVFASIWFFIQEPQFSKS